MDGQRRKQQKSSNSSSEIRRRENKKRSFFLCLLQEKGLSKEKLQCDSGLSETTIKNFIYYKVGYRPGIETLKKMAIALRLTLPECRNFFEEYKAFLSEEEEKEFVLELSTIEKYPQYFIKTEESPEERLREIITKTPGITQKELSVVFGVTTKTIYRWFKKLGIKTTSKKYPKWEFKG